MSDVQLPPDRHELMQQSKGVDGGRVRRAAPIVGLTARTAGEAIVVGLRGRLSSGEQREFHVRNAERYAELLGHSKGVLMKAGQMFSIMSAPALQAEFRPIYEQALRSLCNDAPPMAPQLARETLERELGTSTGSAFAQFDWQPLAAASIGQVHAARLHDGRSVAVKIQYPGVAEAIGADLKNTELLATLLTLIGCMYPRRLRLDLRGAARELTERIGEELDYRLEAATQAEFAALYRGHPFIHIPRVIGELSTGRVLTQELVRGRAFGEAVAARRGLRDSWGEAIYRFVYGSYRRHGLCHGDPHPGNFLFHDDGTVTALDFGFVKRIGREQLDPMNEILRACLHGDVLGTWRACVEAGLWRSTDPVAPEEVFSWWHRESQLLWATEPFTLTPEHATRWFEHKYSLTGPSANALQHLTMPPKFTLVGRTEIAMEALLGQLRATNRWGWIAAEHIEEAAPRTAMGKCEQAFLARRGQEPSDA